MLRLPAVAVFAALTLTLLLAMLLSLLNGPVNLSWSATIHALMEWLSLAPASSLEPFEQVIILDVRLPRLLMAVLVGAILAQSGAMMQGLFRNPLADPGIIGVSSGAAVGAIISIVLMPTASHWAVPVSAFLGGLTTTLLVYGLARSATGTSVFILLLAGVAIAAFCGAAIGFLSYFADDQSLRALNVWQMGSLSGANRANLWLLLITCLILLFGFQTRAGAMNALLLGEAEARHLGIAVERLKIEMIILTAVGVGMAVAFSGIIGFIGLVVPHLVRLLTGPNHHSLLPLSALLGACLLVIADLLARILVAPAELPVGLLTALLGAPFFLVLLLKQRRHWS